MWPRVAKQPPPTGGQNKTQSPVSEPTALFPGRGVGGVVRATSRATVAAVSAGHPWEVSTPGYDRAADLMAEVLVSAGGPLTITELAKRTGVPRGTVDGVVRCDCPRHGRRFWQCKRRTRRKGHLWDLVDAPRMHTQVPAGVNPR